MTVKLLLPFDGSPGARRAAALLSGYAGAAGAVRAAVLNVQQLPLRFWPGKLIEPAAVEAALLDAGRRIAELVAGQLAASGIEARASSRLGPAAGAILEEARERRFDAIVMGTRGTGALRGFAIGSVALRVASGAAVPVLLVKPGARLPRALGQRLRVLAAIDGSPEALRAVERLVAWRGWLGEIEVDLACVQPPLTAIEAMLPPHQDVLSQWSGAEAEAAAEAPRRALAAAGIRHRLHIASGDIAPQICRLARETGCNLAALGTRGLGAAHHALVGSVALQTAGTSPVPVVLVP